MEVIICVGGAGHAHCTLTITLRRTMCRLTVETFMFHKIIVSYCGTFLEGQSRDDSSEQHWRISLESIGGILFFKLIKYVRGITFLGAW